MLLSRLWKNQWVLEIYSWAISADIIHIYVFLKEAIWFHSFIFFHKAKLFVFFFLNYVRLTILIIFCLRITQTKTRISEFSHHVLKLFFVFGKKKNSLKFFFWALTVNKICIYVIIPLEEYDSTQCFSFYNANWFSFQFIRFSWNYVRNIILIKFCLRFTNTKKTRISVFFSTLFEIMTNMKKVISIYIQYRLL